MYREKNKTSLTIVKGYCPCKYKREKVWSTCFSCLSVVMMSYKKRSALFAVFLPSLSLFAASLSFQPTQITTAPRCPVQVDIVLDTTRPTNALDIKVIDDHTLYQIKTLTLSGWVLDIISDVTTGVALSWDMAWLPYYYIFGMMQWDGTIAWSHTIWSLSVTPVPWVSRIEVPLYMIPWRGGDDSTVSTLSWTQIVDVLDQAPPLTIVVDDTQAPCSQRWETVDVSSWFALTTQDRSQSPLPIYLFVALWSVSLCLLLWFFAKKRSSD